MGTTTSNSDTLRELRGVNATLLKASLLDTEPDISTECDLARQPVVEAIRKLDPASATNPPPEEMDVVAFHAAAHHAGKHLIDRITKE